ncbi:hypothetical protein BMS3Abin04_02489 [bacterium BMS3Abin04]|nr:hypothetical protein BMS3Abin04_02489 [bacterium BMS3Abin04]
MTFLSFSIGVLLLLLSGCERDEINGITDTGKPPNAPFGLKISYAFDGTIGIEWTPNNGSKVQGYNIYRSDGDTLNYKKIDFTTSNFYDDDSLQYRKFYYYKVSTVDIFGRESSLTNSVDAQPINKYIPFIAREVTANARNWDSSQSIYIHWIPSPESDIKNYLIYRNTTPNFLTTVENLLDSSSTYFYSDTTNLKLFVRYNYKIITQDKGGLKSKASQEASDFLLDKPLPIFPSNNSSVNYFDMFTVKTASLPANYKLQIRSNAITGILKEISFLSKEKHSNIKVKLDQFTFEPFKTYYWQVFTYTSDNFDPNSFSDTFSFTIVPNNGK